MDVIVNGSPKIEVGFTTNVIEKYNKIDIDSALSTTSENPVMNKVITAELGKKATATALTALETKVDTNKESTDNALLGLSTKVNNNEAEIQSLEKIKANATGYYPRLHVGLSDNLPDRGDVTEGLIGFRESAGADNSIEDGTANVQELLGESLVWNQLIERLNNNANTGSTFIGLTYAYDESSSILTINGTATGTWQGSILFAKTIIDNIYYISAQKVGGSYTKAGSEEVRIFNGYYPSAHPESSPEAIGSLSKNNREYLGIGCNVGDVFDNYQVRVQYINLTQMFEAGKEPSTIEEFNAIKNQLVGVDFNAYNAGEVLSVNIKGIKSVNDNAWDEQWEVGSYDTKTGQPLVNNDAIRTKGRFKILGGQEYFAHAPTNNIFAHFYDAQGDLIKGVSGQYNYAEIGNKKWMSPSDATSMTFYVIGQSTYNHDICIRLAHSGYKTDYVPHKESESSFNLTPYFPNGMHRIGDVRDIVTPKKATRRIGGVDMGTLNWVYNTPVEGHPYGYLSTNLQGRAYGKNNILCHKYIYANADLSQDKSIYGLAASQAVIIVDSSYTDAATFKAAMSGVMLYYELATPIETEIDPQLNMNYKVWDFGTEELLTDSKSAPVLARTIYGFNATDTIRGNKAKNEEQDVRLQTLESEVVRIGDYQPDLSVGVADQLAGQDEPTASEINFRRSGGGAILDGNARIEAIKGNSVVWNQKLIRDNETVLGITTTWVDNIATLSGTATSTYAEIVDSRVPVFNGHKYLVEGWVVSNPNSLSFGFGLFNNISGQLQFDSSTAYKAEIFTCNGYYRSGFGIDNFGGAGTDLTGLQLKARVIDLTQMFEAGKEPTTIEEFEARKPIVADDYAYNEGEVIHMTAEGIKSVGDNAWDEEWESGRFSNMGIEENYSGKIRSKNYIPVLANVDYYYTSPISLNFSLYDKEYRCVGSWQGIQGQDWDIEHPIGETQITFVAGTIRKFPRNVSFIKFSTWGNNLTTYNNDICISLVHSGWKQDTDAGYQPYWEDRLIFDQRIKDEFPNGMKRWDMVYNKNGKGVIVKETRVVKMKDLNWKYYTESGLGNTMVRVTLEGIKIPTTKEERVQGVIVSRYYPTQDNPNVARLQNKCWLHMNGEIFLKDDSFADAESFVASLTDNDVIIYQLAEPTIIEYDEPFNLDYRVADFGTEQAIAEGQTSPLKADIVYGFNAYGTIKQLKEQMATLMTQMAQMQTAMASVTNNEE